MLPLDFQILRIPLFTTLGPLLALKLAFQSEILA